MDRGAWQAAVHGVAQGQTQLKRLSTVTRKKKKSSPTYKEKQLMVTGWEMKGGRGLSGLFYTIIYKAIYMSILKKISPEYSLEGLC